MNCHNLTELPDFSKLPHLKILDLSGCKGLCGGYHFLAQLKMIEELNLSDCNVTDGAVLEIIGSLSSLTFLDLGGNGFSRLPILSGLSQLQFLYLNHCTNLQAIPDLPNSLVGLTAKHCTALEIMPDFSEMSKMTHLVLDDCHKLKDIPNFKNSLDNMDSIFSIHMEGCTSLTDTFKENLQTKNAFGGITLFGNYIPNWLAYVAREDEIVQFKVPPSIDYIGGLALGIVYSSDNSDSTGYLHIDVVNRTQRTYFRIRIWKEAIVTASHEYYLWLGNLSNRKLNLKGGDMVSVEAKFFGGDNRIKVNKTGVDIVKWDLSDGCTNWDYYVTMPYTFKEDIDNGTRLSICNVFLCYKTPEAWPWRIEGSESDPLPKFFASALKARKNDITVKMLLTVIEGREGIEFSDGDVLIFPQMIKYRGLKESDVDSFVDDVLVNRKPWASGVQEPLTGVHVFVCAHCSGEEWNRDSARVLIDKFEEEAELRGLTNQVFVAACYHTGGHNGNLIIYNPCSNGSITSHWYGYVTPDDVPELLDWYQQIGKGDVIDRLWRGQIGASSDEAENINDQKLPNGGEIHETLKLSYVGLPDDHVKGVFIDISCFYIGRSLDIVEAILGGCNHFSVKVEINTLCDRGLLYIDEDKRLRMHDLIRDMGREIVRAESPVELGKRSRLWHSEDAKRVLRNECGTEAVEGLNLFLPEHFDDEQSFSTEAFKKMWPLKLLLLENVTLTGSYKHLSKELRALVWIGFPLEAIPADFDQRNLVHMNLRNSKIIRVWEDSDLLPKKLKFLFLEDCHNLTELPDFSKLPHLEILNLSGCKGLCGGYHFLGQLKMIEELVLSDCNITDGAVLEIIGSLSSLTFLDLGGNGFSRLPILSGLSQLQVLYLSHCTNLQAIPDLPNSLLQLIAKHCTALEIMPDFSEMSKMTLLRLDDCHKLKDIPNFKNSLDYMDSIISIQMEGCTSLTDTFKENLQTKNAFGGITLFGNYIPNWLAYVAREDEIVQFKVPPSIDYIGGLALGIVYSSDNSDSTGYLYIDVVNRTQRTYFRIRIWEEAIVTASHEYYLWLGNLSNRKLNLKGGDMVFVKAKFYGGDNRIKVHKTGVDIVKWHLSDGRTYWDDYVTMPYTSKEDIDNGTRLSICNVFLCYKTPEVWPWRIEGSESDPLPKFFSSALKARKNDITATMLLTVIEGREGTEFSDGDVLIFPQMIKYRGLKESNVDSFVDDVLVNDKPWASGVQESLTGCHVFVCAQGSREEWIGDSARVLIYKFKEEAELRGLTNQVFAAACFHTGGHNGNLIIYSPGSDGSITGHWYGDVTPDDVPELLDEHIGKGKIIERLWRGQMGASSDEAEEINGRELPNGEGNKKIEEKPQENSNQIHQEKGNQIENNENFSGCCQGANSDGFTCCEEVRLEENGGNEEKKLKETRESCVKKDALRKLSSLIGGVATVVVAYCFYRRSGRKVL